MKSNKKMAVIGTVFGLICGLLGLIAGFYNDTLKPLIDSGAWTQISATTLITSAALLLMVISALLLALRRSLRRSAPVTAHQDNW